MSDFDDSYESSIFSDATSSSIDDMIFSDEPPSDDSLDDSVGDLEESHLEEESEKKEDESSNSNALEKPLPEILMTGYFDESIQDPSSEDIIDNQRKLENKFKTLDFSLPGLAISDESREDESEEENEISNVPNKEEYKPPIISLANVDMDSYRKCCDVLRPHPHLRKAFLEPRKPQKEKVSIKVDPPLTPLKSILRSRTGSDRTEDHIEYIKRRTDPCSDSKPDRTEQRLVQLGQPIYVGRPEHTEYKSPRGVKEGGEWIAPVDKKEENSSKPRFSPRDRIYDSLSESTKARLEKLKEERRKKNAEINGNDAAPSPPKPKFNYAKLEMIKNRFEEQQKKKAANSFEMTMMQEEREEQKRRHRETLKKFERMST